MPRAADGNTTAEGNTHEKPPQEGTRFTPATTNQLGSTGQNSAKSRKGAPQRFQGPGTASSNGER